MTASPDRRQAMLTEGRRLFLEQGYTATTVDAICDAAAVTKGAFFHHFRSKDDFAAAVLTFTWQPVLEAYERHRTQLDKAARLVEHIRFMAGWISDTGRLMPMLAQELGSAHPGVFDQIRGYFATWMGELETLLRAAVDETGADVDIEALKEFIIAATEGIPVAMSQFGPQALSNVSERLVRAVALELGS